MRYLILVSAVLMQMCLGATYSWSIYVHPLKLLTGLQQGPVQLPFTAFYFIFPLTMMAGGTLLTKIGPRLSAMIGGLLFGGGWLLASLGSHHFLFTILGIGVLAGIGAGMAYIVPIAVCIRWFPDNKGLVTGIAVAGFGGGAALVSQLGGYMMESYKYTPFQTFFVFGIAFMCCVLVGGASMSFPKEQVNVSQKDHIGVGTLLSHPNFKLLYVAMFVGLAAGFAVNANLKELFQGKGDAIQIGITGVSLFAIANACGRITWGMIFDRIQAATAIQANLLFQAVVLVASPLLVQSKTGFLAIALLTGFNYGGVLVLYVSSASRCWGADKVSQVYGWLFSSNIPASLSPIMAGFVFDIWGSFTYAMVSLALCLVGATFIIMRNKATINMDHVV